MQVTVLYSLLEIILYNDDTPSLYCARARLGVWVLHSEFHNQPVPLGVKNTYLPSQGAQGHGMITITPSRELQFQVKHFTISVYHSIFAMIALSTDNHLCQ
jgi:hypothetical protein